jgi:UDP-N-acetylmuramyl pentapeptide synthase
MKEVFKRIVTAILIAEAKLLLLRQKPTIVAITGSVGKTTAKDAIYAAIKNSVSARKSEKSFNSEIGVPLTILGLQNAWSNPFSWLKNLADGLFIALFSKDYPAVLVLETGIDRPGDMGRLTAWLKPDIVVITRFPSVPVHVEFFSTPEAVVAEKMKLAFALKTDGTLIYNHDDPIIEAQVPQVRQTQVSFGRYLEADFKGTNDQIVYDADTATGVTFAIKHLGEQHQVTLLGTIGSHQVYACTAAFAVASTLGITHGEAAAGLSELRTPNGRLRLIPGIKASMILDDTYNSSPAATEMALQTLGEVKYAKRKIAVIGDMLELGRFSSDEHEKVGKHAAQVATHLVTIGVRAQKVAEGALENGLSEKNIFQYDDVARAGRELQSFLEPGDVVLIKASQGIRAERIVEEIMSDPDSAAELLVRQDEQWKNK